MATSPESNDTYPLLVVKGNKLTCRALLYTGVRMLSNPRMKQYQTLYMKRNSGNRELGQTCDESGEAAMNVRILEIN